MSAMLCFGVSHSHLSIILLIYRDVTWRSSQLRSVGDGQRRLQRTPGLHLQHTHQDVTAQAGLVLLSYYAFCKMIIQFICLSLYHRTNCIICRKCTYVHNYNKYSHRSTVQALQPLHLQLDLLTEVNLYLSLHTTILLLSLSILLLCYS